MTRLLAKDPNDRPGSAAEVYELLVPFAGAASVLDEEPAVILPSGQSIDPTLPYRYPFGPLPRPGLSAPARIETPPATTPYEPTSITDLEEAQHRARTLAEAERFTQAAELLAAAVRAAVKEQNAGDPQLLDLRLDLANLYLLADAYREALAEFIGLTTDLATRPGGDRELIWYCRQQAATCHAELRDAAAAIALLRALLADQQPGPAVDGAHADEPRQQIEVLEATRARGK
ncbi:hypothetical protein ACFPIJ_54140 [Dactylosporangium cerinum]|uniref:Tetratricopeptide repeat protein n=1 Tax=Dactylosporangium cerinum TaxID=1434730 RepID=A0ABV9WFI5_9ACTN